MCSPDFLLLKHFSSQIHVQKLLVWESLRTHAHKHPIHRKLIYTLPILKFGTLFPKTSSLPWIFFALSYSKTALVHIPSHLCCYLWLILVLFMGLHICYLEGSTLICYFLKSITRWKNDLDSKVWLPDGSKIPCLLLANKVIFCSFLSFSLKKSL